MNKSINDIPKGFYCYTRLKNGKLKICPYWSKNNSKPKQNNGYCAYLEKGDWEYSKGITLLWDMCKMCGINEYTDKELDEMWEQGEL